MIRFLSKLWRSLFAPSPVLPKDFYFSPQPLGPKFEWISQDRIHILEGFFQNKVFRVLSEIGPKEAHFFLEWEGKIVGKVDLERNAPEATIVLWNIVVEKPLRHKGLASLLTFIAFRELLRLHNQASFFIRMVRLIKPSDKDIRVQNVGIGVIAKKLGFSPEYNLSQLFAQKNIVEITPLPAFEDMPPAYRIVLRSYPLVLVSFLCDPKTSHPFDELNPIYKSVITPDVAQVWLSNGMIIIGNGNYLLKKEGINRMINHLARNEEEAKIFYQKIKPL
ncbi:MAG: GNAT family N-acetyltransferase [candidate division WOR-3 bacterium]